MRQAAHWMNTQLGINPSSSLNERNKSTSVFRIQTAAPCGCQTEEVIYMRV